MSHVHGWNIIMDEKDGWIKLNGKAKLNGWTQYVRNQELCANVNSTSSQPRGLCQSKHYLFISKRYVPIGNWNNMKPHILNTISHLLFEFNLSNLLCLRSFLSLEKKNYIFPPSPPELTNSIFYTITIHLQLLHIYFTLAKQKFTKMVTLNTLETMI